MSSTGKIEEKVHWSQRDISIPAGLGVAAVPAEVAGLYVKMRTVGTEARSGLDRLQSRTGWGRDKLKKWQNVGWELGWWMLLTEGRAAGDGKTGVPRQWWLCSRPFELPPQDLVARVLNSRTLPPQPESWSRVLNSSSLKFSSLESRTQTSSLIDQQSRKEREEAPQASPEASAAAPSLDAAHTDSEQVLLLLDPGYRARYGRALSRSTLNKDSALKAAAAYVTDLAASWASYLSDPGRKDNLKLNRHPLAWFAEQPDTYLPLAPATQSPAKMAAAREAKERQELERQRKMAEDVQADRELRSRWSNLDAVQTHELLLRVEGLGTFQKDTLKRHAETPMESDALRLWIREVWTEYPVPPLAA